MPANGKWPGGHIRCFGSMPAITTFYWRALSLIHFEINKYKFKNNERYIKIRKSIKT